MKEKLVAERQCAMGAECHLVSSLVGVAQHVVWCLLGLVLHVPTQQGQLAPPRFMRK